MNFIYWTLGFGTAYAIATQNTLGIILALAVALFIYVADVEF